MFPRFPLSKLNSYKSTDNFRKTSRVIKYSWNNARRPQANLYIFLQHLSPAFNFGRTDYKILKNPEFVGLEDFEMKIDQIAKSEHEVPNGKGVGKNDDDSDWITNLYRQFNDPMLSSMNTSEVPQNGSYER